MRIKIERGQSAKPGSTARPFPLATFIRFLIIAFIISVIFAGVSWFMESNRRAQIASDMIATTEHSTEGIARALKVFYRDLLILSDTHALDLVLQNPTPESRRTLESVYARYASHDADIRNIRYIDASGQEIVRVNVHEDEVEIVQESELQNKADRYYFQNTIGLDPGRIYVSPLDLSLENGQIVEPWEPAIRFATPIADASGEVQGIVIISVVGHSLLRGLNELNYFNDYATQLLNEDGFWLHGAPIDDLWGFMFGNDAQMSQRNPEVWDLVVNGLDAPLWRGNKLYTAHVFDPAEGLPEGLPTDSVAISEQWILFSEHDDRGASLMAQPIFWVLYLISISFAAAASWMLGKVKQQETEVNRQTKLLQGIIDGTSSAIFVKDASGRYTLTNNQFERMFKLSHGSALGKTNKELSIAIDFDRPCPARPAGLERREVQRQEISLDIGSDSKTFASNHVMISGDHGESDVIATILTDITDIKNTRDELARQKDAAEQASRAKSAFVASMSHELRTPLNAIIGYSEMLSEIAEDDGNDEYTSDLKRIRKAGRHLLGLVNDILDISKIEAGRMEVIKRDFNLRALIDEVIETTEVLTAQNNNALVVDYALSCSDEVHADELKIKQILLNLLSNAAKFTTDGEISVHVRSNAQSEANWLVVEVRDTGIGMDPERAEQLFDDFAQADAATERSRQGTGLGLAICRRLTELMGGKIELETKLGEGALFRITLPIEVTMVSPGSLKHTMTASDPAIAALNRQHSTILIVDDDPNAREITTRLLMREGFQVATAAAGQEGLDVAQRLQPDAIVLDILMEGMDGWEVLGHLKDSLTLRAIPVITCSIVDDRKTSAALGAADHLTKPYDGTILIECLERVMLPSPEGPVLVIDDDHDTRDILVRQIESMGLEAIGAVGSLDAFEKLAKIRRPWLILLDLVMPDIDGFAFLKAIRELDDYKDIPVVIATTKSLTSSEQRILEHDVVRIIQKGDPGLRRALRELQAFVMRSNSRDTNTSESEAAA